MAVTVTTSPATRSPVYNCIKWILNIDDLGSGDITKKIGYQLFDGDNNEITALESTDLVDPEIDFQEDVRALVQTKLIDHTQTTIVEDDEIYNTIYLRYGDIVYDFGSDTCDVTNQVVTDTAEITIYNIATQPEYDLPTSDEVILSSRPLSLELCKGVPEYIWVLGTLDGDVVYRFYYNDGEPNSQVWNLASALNTVHIIPLAFPESFYGVGVIPDLSTMTKIEIDIAINGGTVTYTRYLKNCCGDIGIHGVYFLEAMGGRALMPMELVDNIDLNMNFTEVYRYHGCVDDYTTGGRSIIDKENKDLITFQIESLNNADNLTFFKDFFNSAGYHILDNNLSQTVGEVTVVGMMKKFIVNSGSIRVYKENDILTLTVTGYVSRQYNSQRIDQ